MWVLAMCYRLCVQLQTPYHPCPQSCSPPLCTSQSRVLFCSFLSSLSKHLIHVFVSSFLTLMFLVWLTASSFVLFQMQHIELTSTWGYNLLLFKNPLNRSILLIPCFCYNFEMKFITTQFLSLNRAIVVWISQKYGDV